MDPTEFLTLAHQLRTEHSEAARRTAVSRAYYSALHVAARIVERHKLSLRSDHRFHEDVRAGLDTLGVAGLSDRLGTLETYRGSADYELDSDSFSEGLDDAFLIAEAVVADLSLKFR